MPNKNVAYIEDECLAEEIIYKLAEAIDGATWKDIDGVTPITNRWEKVYESLDEMWVTYKENFRNNVAGIYKHTDGNSYPVYIMRDNTNSSDMDADGMIAEVSESSNGTPTGKKLQIKEITYTDDGGVSRVVEVPGMLLVLLPDPADPTGLLFECWIVEQKRTELDGTTITPDTGWNEFRLLTKMPASAGDYVYAMQNLHFYTSVTFFNGDYHGAGDVAPVAHKFNERYYTADPVHFYERSVALKCTPDVPSGGVSQDYFILMKMPKEQYNYFDVYYGTGFVGTTATGTSASTYERACNVSTVKYNLVPTIINQKEAEAAYIRWNDEAVAGRYTAPSETWDKDIDGVTDVKSPPAHFFFGADSVVPWLAAKKRRPDYWVTYYISLNNDRAGIILEGDPAPDMDGYYRTFGYLGRITPFSDYDYPGNFGVTIGMGHLVAAKTGVVLADIKQDTNPTYSGFGRYTSNGMYSFSMLRTRSNVLFQAYYPAFVTQLPNYKGTGTIPAELSKLIVERNGFQPSVWTEKYHGSPIYLAHQFEGYRGYLTSVIAVNDHNLINEDELVVDTEEWKDPADHSKGTYQEVYKFFSLISPVSFFDYSANPDEMTVAVLKEVK